MTNIYVRYPKCFYVFVGEKKVKDFQSISETVEIISKFFGRTRPTSIVVMGKFNNLDILDFSSYFFNYPMVRFCVTNVKPCAKIRFYKHRSIFWKIKGGGGERKRCLGRN